MTYAQASTSDPVSRVCLFGIALALHAGALYFILSAKPAVPALLETPLMVQFIEPPKPLEMAAAPRPSSPAPPKREAVRPPRPTPAPPRNVPTPPRPLDTPPLETTASSEPAPASAPVVAEPPPAAARLGSSSGVSQGSPATGASGGSGDSVGARFDADYLKNPAPPYPPQSRRIGEEGKVILRVFVTADGSAHQVEIKTSSGSDRLDESAQRTVRRWKFIPARRGGNVVESWVLVPIVFKLEQ